MILITYSDVYLCNLQRKDRKELNQDVTSGSFWMVGSRVMSPLYLFSPPKLTTTDLDFYNQGKECL